MAKYEITHTCGHLQTHQIYGPNTRGQRAYQARQLAARPCDTCTRATRDQVSAAATEMAQAAGWPTLTGTPRQIAWAQTLRADVLAALIAELADHPQIPDAIREEVVDLYTRVALREQDAGWWITSFARRGTGRPAAIIVGRFAAADRAALAALREIAAGRTQDLTSPEPDPQPAPAADPEQPADDSPTAPQAAIRTLRAAGWTVRKIAADLGVHPSTVYRWQSGQRTPNARNAAALALLANR